MGIEPTISPSNAPTESIPIIVRPITNNPTISGTKSVIMTSVINDVTENEINNENDKSINGILPFDVENYLIIIILSVILLCTCCIFLSVFVAIKSKKTTKRGTTNTKKNKKKKENEMIPTMHSVVASQSVIHSPSVTTMEPNVSRIKSYSQMSAITPNGVLDILDNQFVEGNGHKNVNDNTAVTPMGGHDNED